MVYMLLVVGNRVGALNIANVSTMEMNALRDIYLSANGEYWYWDEVLYDNSSLPWDFATVYDNSSGSFVYLHDPCIYPFWQCVVCTTLTDENNNTAYHIY